MKILTRSSILITLILYQCNNPKTQITNIAKIYSDTITENSIVSKSESSRDSVSILILPPFDSIANAGISPNTNKILEDILTKTDGIKVLKFPYQKLQKTDYYMIYDKKHCKELLNYIKPDVFIMTLLRAENNNTFGNWPWYYQVKLYNVNSDKQLISIEGKGSSESDLERTIIANKDKLIHDILEAINKITAANTVN